MPSMPLLKSTSGLLQLIAHFIDEQHITENKLLRLQAGDNEVARSAKSFYKRSTERLKRLVANYCANDKLRFLRFVSTILAFE
jgi:hypothetical protein